MSRQRLKPRPKQGITRGAQRAAGGLDRLRLTYERLGPDHADFERALGKAAARAALLEASLGQMSRPNGHSRRAASAGFVEAHVLRGACEIDEPEASPYDYAETTEDEYADDDPQTDEYQAA